MPVLFAFSVPRMTRKSRRRGDDLSGASSFPAIRHNDKFAALLRLYPKSNISLSLSHRRGRERGARDPCSRAMTHAAKHRSGALSAREGCSADKTARAAPRRGIARWRGR
jgi:hypothetical protein